MTGSYPTLRELISRLNGNDKKVCDLALDCLIIQDKQIKELRAEVEKYKAIASKAIREQIDVRKDERERCAALAERWTYSLSGRDTRIAEEIVAAIMETDK